MLKLDDLYEGLLETLVGVFDLVLQVSAQSQQLIALVLHRLKLLEQVLGRSGTSR